MEVDRIGGCVRNGRPSPTGASASATESPLSASAMPTRFDEIATAVRTRPAYAALSEAGQKHVETILKHARTSSKQAYYLAKLELLLSTPDAPAAPFVASQTQRLNDAVADARQVRAALPPAAAATSERREEAMVAQASRRWTVLKGAGETAYWVDRSDPEHIVAVIQVHLTGKVDIAANVKRLEDAIEKHLGTANLTVDLRFVDKQGPGIFEVGCDPSKWTTARNWVGRTASLGHELMHLLGLEDEYDYIELHAANRNMQMATRLYWFTAQLGRTPKPDWDKGIMAHSTMKPLRRHARAVAQLPEPDPARAGVSLRNP